jgi:hypothetical protein
MKYTAFYGAKNGDFAACLKNSVSIFVNDYMKYKRLVVEVLMSYILDGQCVKWPCH